MLLSVVPCRLFLSRVVWFICHKYQLYEMMKISAKSLISKLTLPIIMLINSLIKIISSFNGELCPAR